MSYTFRHILKNLGEINLFGKYGYLKLSQEERENLSKRKEFFSQI